MRRRPTSSNRRLSPWPPPPRAGGGGGGGGGGSAAAHSASTAGGAAPAAGATNGLNEQSPPPESPATPCESSYRSQCPLPQSTALAGSASNAISARSSGSRKRAAGVAASTTIVAGSVKSTAKASSA